MTSNNNPNTTATGEIFSPDATAGEHEKIVKPFESTAFLPNKPEGDVTLMSNSSLPCHTVEKMPSPDLLSDLMHLNKMQLRTKYAAEASCHRNMLHRCKSKGVEVHPAFREFHSFLRHVGPMPAAGATLDRIDNSDPEYAPGKVRWADRHTQNNNKGDTLTFYNSATGETFTASRLAKIQKVSPSTIRQRRQRGWSDDDVIAGKKESPSLSQPRQTTEDPSTSHPFLPRSQRDSSRSNRPKSAAQILFEREESWFAHCRESSGEEGLPAPHYVINEACADIPGVEPITEEQWKRRFVKLWPGLRPHLIFENADPYHQRVIEEIDPDYVRRWREQVEITAKVSASL